jgi:hypothetical protein
VSLYQCAKDCLAAPSDVRGQLPKPVFVWRDELVRQRTTVLMTKSELIGGVLGRHRGGEFVRTRHCLVLVGGS